MKIDSRYANMTLWLTGRPCAGKTTLGEHLRRELIQRGYRVVNLDGDVVRGRLNADLGFSENDRKENLRRVSHIAQLFNENGNFVIATFITPTNDLRAMVRANIKEFKLCYVRCSLQVCEKRDVKGMYQKARKGQIQDFTGISAPFEDPHPCDISVDTEHLGVEDCTQHILKVLFYHAS